MKDLGSWALDNKKLVYVLILLFTLGGIFAYDGMSKLEDPEIKVKQATVVTLYPGASAHEVELEVSDVLEKSIRSMNNVGDITSRSQNDVSTINVKLPSTVPDEKVEESWSLLRRKVADVQDNLPEGASASIVMDDFGDVYGIVYALTFDGYSYKEAEKYADLIKKEVLKIKGVSKIEIYGQQNECINIELYEDRMANMGVHPAEVISTLNGQNATIYSGYYETGDVRMRVSVNDKYRNVDDIGDLILQGHENDQLRLRDIARITESYETPVRNELRYDQKQALGISISAKAGTDITKIGKEVETLISKLEQDRLPAGMETNKVFFQPDRVNSALYVFMKSLIEAIVIVIVLLVFTMGFKSAFILGVNLIVVVLGSLLILGALDGALQRVSLAAFVLALGMLVDNAVVVLDGIQIDLQRGLSRREALTSMGRKTAMPLLGATVIGILAFFPIYLSPDDTGIYVRDLFVVLAVSLLLSWVLAIALIPVQADGLLKAKQNIEQKDPYDNFIYRKLREILTWVLSHRIITVSIAGVMVIISMFCFRFMPQSFFPDMEYDQLYIEYKLPEGSNTTRVKKDLESIESYLLKREEVTHVTTSVGGTPSRYNLVRGIADPSLAYGELIVDYKTFDDLLSSMAEIDSYLKTNYPQARVQMKRYNLMGQSYPIEVEFRGADPAILRDLTKQAKDIMQANADIGLVTSDWEVKTPLLMIDYNQPIARNIGLSRQDVGLSVMSATDGIPTGTFYEGTKSKSILIKSVDKDGKPIESLEHTPVFSMMPSLTGIDQKTIEGLMTGAVSEEDVIASALRTVPLSQAANGIKLLWEEPLVIRRDGERAMRAQCNVLPGKGTESVRENIASQIENIKLPEGYTMKWKGEFSTSNESMDYLLKYYPLAIALMVIILILLFKDYKKPLIIILCLPLMFIGIVPSIILTGKAFGFVAIVATLGLMGLIIRNGIILMDEIVLQISEGVEPVKALLESSASRLRPVMLTTFATALGMIPLLGDALFGSAAVVMMGGLLIGTLVVLLFLPALYALFFGIKNK
ncbi:efflux RND transporter permease subunit [Dysgonomonas capnocytophagoides]|uniref:efflux RND transporter permease subunit n=1 Tax=Dysgonomonas capnocytophagoides TaxID=45254 RepID=UPI00333EA99F